MIVTEQDIIDFVKEYRKNFGVLTVGEDIAAFVEKLQGKFAQMDYSVPQGATVLVHSGLSAGQPTWLVVAKVVERSEGEDVCYSSFPAGKLLTCSAYAVEFQAELKQLLNDNQEVLEQVLHGYYEIKLDSIEKQKLIWIRPNNCYNGIGDEQLTMDDFVATQILSNCQGANSNLIILAPERIDMSKVFVTTELDVIMENLQFEYINGIPIEKYRELYQCGLEGKIAICEIISFTSKEALGS